MTTEHRHPWLARIIDSAAVWAVIDGLDPARPTRHGITVTGARGSSTNLLAGALAVRTQRPILYVVAHLDEADDALDDLTLFTDAGHDLEAERFSALEVLPGESAVSLELLAERLRVIAALSDDAASASQTPQSPISNLKPKILIAPIQALMQAVPRPEALPALALSIEAGKDLPPQRLAQWLTDAGYNRLDAIEQPGDFAVRGGIIDIYPPAGTARAAFPQQTGATQKPDAAGEVITELGPIRLDYFGDEVESIRRIDESTMGSAGQLRRVRIVGASVKQLQDEERTTNLIDLLPPDTVVVLQEPMELSEQARGYYERLTNPRGVYAPNTVMRKLTALAHVEVHGYGRGAAGGVNVALPVEPLQAFDQDAGRAIEELGELVQRHEVTVICRGQAEGQRLRELIGEHAAAAVDRIVVEVGYLFRGFRWAEDQARGSDSNDGRFTVLVPHHELFHRYHVPGTGPGAGARRRVRRLATAGAGAAVSDAFLDLSPGDYVVHVDHGIARFAGLKVVRRSGVSQEFLTLEFADSALLHVPATQIELVQKYVGGFEGRPPLSVLGGQRWKKQKEAVGEAVKDMAAELLRVQAARASQPGIRYPDDTAWQREFEAEFPYEETDDQLAAIAAVKRDMLDEQPMDRLVCGDVGFGKTEVAIRAAFKAVEFGKQVAVLVPTTVLAEQHERTFRGRMADYPFRIASLSRFKTAGEQGKIIKDLAAGRVDVVIGTHRLLSEDVKFADLGMVIIDEEQRFGVEHKNKLLGFRLTADVLTLTATPIPRTLHMAMIGLRDISSLSTPPLDRRAIVTEVAPYQRERVKQALVRELSRDGQAFFVHNRVHNIQSVADELHQLVPQARIAIGHGQMSPRELEKVMLRFMRREVDVLVSTTIIESGIDIPTANTMFINQADHFGLAELHQLRGRVGRYKHRAYCYLLLPEDRTISEVAARRLKAIEQYAMLGAGFKIAMRDLEIRGAGNLLGAEQSGHIAAVGYEMYCQLLDQATRRLRQEKIIEPTRTHLELPVTGQIPKGYIASDKFRMEAYRRLSRASTLAELDAVVEDLKDAYGEPPEQAKALFELTELRIAASTHGVDKLKLEPPDLIFTVQPRQRAALMDLLKDAPGRVSQIDERSVYYRPPTNYLEPMDTLFAVLRKLLVRPLRAN